MPMSDATQPGSVKKLNAKPTTMPGSVIDVRQQVMLEIDREEHDQRAAEDEPRRQQRRPGRSTTTRARTSAAVSASTIG